MKAKKILATTATVILTVIFSPIIILTTVIAITVITLKKLLQ